MKEKKINFFIIGAPKCGTTALASYLSEHDKVFMSSPKEPHFFATDFPNYRCCTSMDQYCKIFDGVNNTHLAVGEASVYYLYSKEAIKNIKEYNSDAKIIIMLRNPVEMVYSLHSQLYYNSDETIENFEEAWNLEKERKQNKNIPSTCREPKMLYYSEIAKYNEQLKNIYKYFPKSQVKVIIFDDIKKNMLIVYKDVLKFLNVPYEGKVNFEKVNENKTVKFKSLNLLINHPPKIMINFIMNLKSFFGIEQFGILKIIRKNNTYISKRKPLNKTLEQIIYKAYENDIKMLSQELNRDLSSWQNN